ncbi:pumilio domain-containing protein [Thecamonas trahens ATCC 50062]|uniref:Pumilio domain-containing protein n=1 Tax=Thecamonas trahens ATCC 50062 TaxID=461836 RepID=A0A0L0D9G5_THETB|nr:pumilio domain-containing protein [Thecamonas trahens ATCC 50062]KNC49012.1 pumilio domain-containing protein [Thecamonas trahens ATCC 50062]|eukprot:XP_013758423.1 pumilio domain-containing protein [Thecamonas trahens ATCC 50062]
MVFKKAAGTVIKRKREVEEETVEERKKQKRLEQKELKKNRKNARAHGDAVARAKAIWERVRPGATAISGEKRFKLVEELMTLLRGQVMSFAAKHDGSRVVQWALKAGSEPQRLEIFGELQGQLAELMCSPYGHFVVRACLGYLRKPQLKQLLEEIRGSVRKLLTHRTASIVLDRIYCLYANSHQQADMMSELYAPKFELIFPGESSSAVEVEDDAAKAAKAQPNLPLFHSQLARLLAKYPAKAGPVMEYLAKTINVVVHKGTLNSTLAHVALEQYLLNATETQRAAMIESVRDSLVEVMHTAPGARAAILAISHGTTKDRKAIVRSFKGFVARIAMEEYGHLVLIRALTVIDDTVLTYKTLLKELVEAPAAPGGETPPSLAELVCDPFASRVFTNILALCKPQHLAPWQMYILSLTRGNRSGDEAGASEPKHYSKKSPELIQAQLLQKFAAPLFAAATESVDAALSETSSAALIAELVTAPIESLASQADARAALVDAILAGVLTDGDDGEPAGYIFDFAASRALKAMVRASEADTASEFGFNFAAALVARLTDAAGNDGALWGSLATSRGSDFVLLSLLESDLTGSVIADHLAPHADAIAAASNPGAKHISKRLSK